MKAFGENLKELRIASGLSQEKLAKQLDITVKSIQRYEKGFTPDTYILIKLAKFFNVSTDYLLGVQSYIKQLDEKEDKLKGKNGYNELYSNYLKCINNYEITKEETYYWINLVDGCIGGQTQYEGWADSEHKLEIRRLRPINPKIEVERCARVIGRHMVINSLLDVIIFCEYGGEAIIRKDICEKYLPEFLKDFIVESHTLNSL